MYIPKHFAELRLEALHELIRSCPFGTWKVETRTEPLGRGPKRAC